MPVDGHLHGIGRPGSIDFDRLLRHMHRQNQVVPMNLVDAEFRPIARHVRRDIEPVPFWLKAEESVDQGLRNQDALDELVVEAEPAWGATALQTPLTGAVVILAVAAGGVYHGVPERDFPKTVPSVVGPVYLQPGHHVVVRPPEDR